MPPRHHRDTAALRFNLSQQRRLLLGRPFAPTLDPPDNLHLLHRALLLDLQKEAPEAHRISKPPPLRYTAQTGRLRTNHPRELS